MTNIVNLSDRMPKQPKPIPADAIQIMEAFVDDYINAAIQDMPLAVVMDYAKLAMEHEIRSMPFDEAVAKIEKEYPEIAGQYKAKLLP